MNKRPLSVTIISWLFIAMGVIAFVYHFIEFSTRHTFQYDGLWVLLLRLIAIVAGVFMLRGNSWARWLTIFWMAYHVVLSWFHSWQQLVIHGLFLAVLAYFLFRVDAAAYFRGTVRNR
jgi:hypothetical protein